MKVEFITRDEMDGIAASVLQNAGIPYIWTGNVQRVDIDALIEFGFGLEIEWDNIDSLGSENSIVLAAIFPKRKLIYLNETQMDLFIKKMGTMNFSKAHELGHWVLHITGQQDYDQLSFTEDEVFFCRDFSKRPPQEVQADMFAASILMPKNIIAGAINAIKQTRKISWKDLYNLRDQLEVSISALTARVQELGLLYISDRDIYNSESEAMGQLSF